jgi:hypothetical protein
MVGPTKDWMGNDGSFGMRIILLGSSNECHKDRKKIREGEIQESSATPERVAESPIAQGDDPAEAVTHLIARVDAKRLQRGGGQVQRRVGVIGGISGESIGTAKNAAARSASRSSSGAELPHGSTR